MFVYIYVKNNIFFLLRIVESVEIVVPGPQVVVQVLGGI